MVTLLPFEHTLLTKKFSISVNAQKNDRGIELSYRLLGPLKDLVIPLRQDIKKEVLWEHSCFEAFIKKPRENSYYEWNASTRGTFNIFSFAAYRKGRKDEASQWEKLYIQVSIKSPEELELHLCSLPRAKHPFLNYLKNSLPLEIYPSVILEHVNKKFSYWAPEHLGKKPDFHKHGRGSLIC